MTSTPRHAQTSARGRPLVVATLGLLLVAVVAGSVALRVGPWADRQTLTAVETPPATGAPSTGPSIAASTAGSPTPSVTPSTPRSTPRSTAPPRVSRGSTPRSQPAERLVPVAPSSPARPSPTATPSSTPTATASSRRATRTPSAPPSPSAQATGDAALEAEVLRLVNVQRATVGCGAVHADRRLTTAARRHSQDMADQGYFSHTSADGRTPWDRMKAAGYTAGSAENIAAGAATAAAVMTMWMDSPGHRANILDCGNHALGTGVGRGGPYATYWTQDFGRS